MMVGWTACNWNRVGGGPGTDESRTGGTRLRGLHYGLREQALGQPTPLGDSPMRLFGAMHPHCAFMLLPASRGLMEVALLI